VNKSWRDVALDALFALIWFASGYFGLSALGISEWSLYAGLINTIIGMWLIILATRTEGQARRLYRGIHDNGDRGFSLPLALLIAVPMLCIFAGLVGWVVRLVGLLLAKH